MTTPNPGSPEAIEQGCMCPVMDNHKGKGVLQPDGTTLFWYTSNCSVHCVEKVNFIDEVEYESN